MPYIHKYATSIVPLLLLSSVPSDSFSTFRQRQHTTTRHILKRQHVVQRSTSSSFRYEPSAACYSSHGRCMVNMNLMDPPPTVSEDSDDDDSSNKINDDDKIAGPAPRKTIQDYFKSLLKDLAKLSLKDYNWRSSLFKTNEADRQMEESLARMMGEDPSYIRPMDATDDKRGPLGQAEKNLVDWLSRVIEEEGYRAQLIANANGTLIRPIDLSMGGSGIAMGPLSELERSAVSFLRRLSQSESERTAMNRYLRRPMDLSADKRGPLGDAEAIIVDTLATISQSESTRKSMMERRNETVRPMDVPGPLGEWEKVAMDFVTAERRRVKERREAYLGEERRVIRPKDARWENPLGVMERNIETAVERLTREEEERLRNVLRVMEKNRPMEVSRESPLGLLEALVVGLLRAPRVVVAVWERVSELWQSERLTGLPPRDGVVVKDLNEVEKRRDNNNNKSSD